MGQEARHDATRSDTRGALPPLTIVALAGLPGTGKSRLARRLALELDAPLFDKDRVREALFGPRHVSYTREQDDACVRALHVALEHAAFHARSRNAVLDGRTYARAAQVRELVELARRLAARLVWIECRAAREVVRARLEQDARDGGHPARDRSFARYLELEAQAEPLAVERLELDTGASSDEECLALARAWIARA